VQDRINLDIKIWCNNCSFARSLPSVKINYQILGFFRLKKSTYALHLHRAADLNTPKQTGHAKTRALILP